MTKFRISISGLNLHYALEFFEKQNIIIEDVVRKQKSLTLTIKKEDYNAFKTSAIYPTFKVKIKRIFGPQKFLFCLVKHIGIILGALIVAFSVFNLTSKVSEVDIVKPINHNCSNGDNCIFTSSNMANLREELANMGVKSGAKLSALPSPRNIEKSLSSKFKQISGVNIKKKGVFVEVEILEATLPLSQTSQDLICSVNGIVSAMDISSGKALVKIGDIVSKGQTLVESQDIPVCAKITIRAFFHETIIHNENMVTYERTGKSTSFSSLELFGSKTKDNAKKPYSLYETEQTSRYVFYNLVVPLKSVTTTYWELKPIESTIPYESVEEKLKKQLEEKALSLLPEGSQKVNTTYINFREGSRIRLDCYVEAMVVEVK